MGEKEKYLAQIISELYPHARNMKHVRIDEAAIYKNGYFEEVASVFNELGGIDNNMKVFHGEWDIGKEGFAIELDEERHFNRYRLRTLESDFYTLTDFEWSNRYKVYCLKHEENCLKAASYGGNWSNNSCEKMFGEASPHGVLTDNGAPRWKQRAFYDYLKDINAHILKIKFVRIPIWDTHCYNDSNHLIKDVLIKKNEPVLVDYIKKVMDGQCSG